MLGKHYTEIGSSHKNFMFIGALALNPLREPHVHSHPSTALVLSLWILLGHASLAKSDGLQPLTKRPEFCKQPCLAASVLSSQVKLRGNILFHSTESDLILQRAGPSGPMASGAGDPAIDTVYTCFL